MRSLHRNALVYAAAFFAASCGGSGEAPSDELLRDLSAAQSSSIELAARVQDYQPTRFVTAVEQLPVAAPTRARAPRRVFKAPEVGTVPLQESTPEPEPAQEIAQTPVPVAEEPHIASAVPSVVPRPNATPATPASSGDGGGHVEGPSRGEVLGTIIGEAIGVVIRGGPVGPGHCPPRRGRPRGIILPLEMPLVRPDFRR
ncbi:MAG: hypothetical protein AB1762_13345 [Gemmatimonadota bacterium]